MLCAHTVRRLQPGAFERFIETFVPDEGDMPAGWVRFHALRGVADPDEVVTFGFFDGTLEELERSQRDSDFEGRRAAIAPLVADVIANGVYDVVESRLLERSAAR